MTTYEERTPANDASFVEKARDVDSQSRIGDDEKNRLRGISAPLILNPHVFGIPPSLVPEKGDEFDSAWKTFHIPIEEKKNLGVPQVTELPINVFQQFLVPNPSRLAESCVAKVVIGTVMGGVLGMGFGIIMSSFEGMSPPVTMPGQPEPPKKTWKQELRDGARKTKAKSKSWGKNFASLTAMFQGFECAIEKTRGKHDIYNSVSAGCFTGAALARQSGLQAMGLGCAGFAAFSAVIDTVMGTH